MVSDTPRGYIPSRCWSSHEEEAVGAVRHVGRVGGLAVSLGVGAAIFAGYGVASAEPALDARLLQLVPTAQGGLAQYNMRKRRH